MLPIEHDVFRTVDDRHAIERERDLVVERDEHVHDDRGKEYPVDERDRQTVLYIPHHIVFPQKVVEGILHLLKVFEHIRKIRINRYSRTPAPTSVQYTKKCRNAPRMTRVRLCHAVDYDFPIVPGVIPAGFSDSKTSPFIVEPNRSEKMNKINGQMISG